MTEADSEVAQDVQQTSLADVTHDSCVLQLIEIVALNRPSDLLLLVCVSFTIIGQPRNSVLICRV